jgi:pimeloyl-ACP methyl ester carboxylesterase
MTDCIELHSCQVEGLRIQYREINSPSTDSTLTAARKPIVVLLHPSPRSSLMFEPWMKLLAPWFHVLAMDTPGYGGSDSLPQQPTSLSDYLPALNACLQKTIGAPCLLYGSATGAQLAIAYAHRYPDQIAHLFLDNAAHLDDHERQHLLAHYFPNLTPNDNRDHLKVAWQMARGMLTHFPWFENTPSHRISPREPSAAEIHAVMMEFLAAGPSYSAAYRAAMAHEKVEHVLALKIPTTVFRWEGSVLLKYIDKLLSFQLPDHIQTVNTPIDMKERYRIMTDHLRQCALRTSP